MKIIHKLITGFLVVISLGAVTGLLALNYSKELLKTSFIDSTDIMASKVLHGIENELVNKIDYFYSLVHDPLVVDTVVRSNREFRKIKNVSELLERRNREWIAHPKNDISPFMRELTGNELALMLTDRQEFYREYHGYAIFGEIFITNQFGVNVAQTGRTSDYIQADEQWWQNAKNKRLSVEEVDYDESSTIHSINIAIRIDDYNGEFAGVLKVTLNIKDVINLMKFRSAGIHQQHNTMNYTLVNSNGKVIYSTENFEFLDDVSHLLVSHISGLYPSSDGLALATMSPMGNRAVQDSNIVTHVKSLRLKGLKELSWSLIIRQDADELFAPVSKLRNRILLSIAIISLIGLVVGLSISNHVSRNIGKLRDASVQIGKGDLNVKIGVASHDEIGELAQAFQAMTENLKTTTVARDELADEVMRRKLAEETIMESEDRFRSVAENASDAIIYIDGRGEVIFWNKAAESIFGYTADEMVGRDVQIIMPSNFRDSHVNGLSNVLQTGKSKLIGKTVEIMGLRKDSKEFPVELSLSTWNIRDEKYFTAIIRDISDRKHTERIIQRQLGRLSALRSIDKAIIASLDLNVTLDVFLSEVIGQLKVDAASVLLLNNYTQLLEHVASKGFRSSALKYTKLRLGESNAGRAAVERHIVSIPDLTENIDGFICSKQFLDEGFISYFAVPLIAKGQVKGVMEIFNRSSLNPSMDWIEFLEAIADQGAIALDNATLFKDLQRTNIDLSMAYDTTIEGWSRALDMRDKETEGHSQRVTELSVRIAREYRMRDEEILQIRRGALLHDIGKMGIPDSILLKPGKLTDEEWVIMKQHPSFARDLLFPIEYLRPAIDIPYYHHEKWDGTGYPEGLKGEKIPLAARIFAVVDVWDALRSDRPYRPSWPKEKVIEYIRSQVGTHFDAGVVEMFLTLDL